MINSLVVVFETPIKMEQAQAYIDAISLFEGVIEVKENVSNLGDFVNQSVVRNALAKKLFEALYDE